MKTIKKKEGEIIDKKRKQYLIEYRSKKCKNYTLQLSRENDGDVIKHLEKQPNKNAYLKNLIVKDMQK